VRLDSLKSYPSVKVGSAAATACWGNVRAFVTRSNAAVRPRTVPHEALSDSRASTHRFENARPQIRLRVMKRKYFWFGALLTMVSTMFSQERSPSTTPADFDAIIKDGTVYDGIGAEPKQADVAIRADRIVGIGDFKAAKAKTMINAKGLAVAPGFINMLSWSTVSLIQDGRSQSEIRQGVTTEIMGEGESMGPVNDRVREHMVRQQIDVKYDIKWNTLAEYLQYLEKRGVRDRIRR